MLGTQQHAERMRGVLLGSKRGFRGHRRELLQTNEAEALEKKKQGDGLAGRGGGLTLGQGDRDPHARQEHLRCGAGR